MVFEVQHLSCSEAPTMFHPLVLVFEWNSHETAICDPCPSELLTLRNKTHHKIEASWLGVGDDVESFRLRRAFFGAGLTKSEKLRFLEDSGMLNSG